MSNMKYYSFAEKDGLEKIREKMNKLSSCVDSEQVSLGITHKQNKESPKHGNVQGFR